MRDVISKLRMLLSRRDKRVALVLLLMMFIGAAMEMVGVGAIPAFIALLSDPGRFSHYRIAQLLTLHLHARSPSALILTGAGVLLLIFAVKNLYLSMVVVAQARYTTQRQISIASRLFRVYLYSPYTVHLQRNSAELLRNANNESFDVVGAVLMPLLTLVLEAMTAGAILALLFVAEPVISLIATILLGGATALFLKVVRRRLAYYGQLVQLNRMQIIKTASEALGSAKTTQVLGREDHFLRTYSSQGARFAESLRFRQVMNDIPRLYLETVAILGILGIAAMLIAQGRPTQSIIPTLSLLAVAIVRMIPSFNRITTSLNLIRYGRFALDVVFRDITELESRTRTTDTKASPLTLERTLQIDSLSYRYPGAANPSLVDITLTIPRGSVVGLVGPTGAGKTTLVDVILGVLEPTSGQILIDGEPVGTRVSSWQRQVGYVPQDVFLIDDSIRRNVAFGLADDEIDEAAVTRAVSAAQLTDFLATLPQGLDTIVGERGVRLSGGQRQRIGIARALYHDPEVLILDEATSSLDNETERYVMEAVEHLRGQRTIIIIAHRLSTVKDCDRLFMLRQGRLVESGRYDELIAAGKHFRRLATSHEPA